MVGTFPADHFIFDAGVSDFMTVRDEQLPDSFGSESLFSGMFEVRLKILVDLLADSFSEEARGLENLPVLRQDLVSFSLLYIIDPAQVLFRGIQGYVQFAGYFLVGTIEFVQIDDSTYICHRFHLWPHLSAYLGEGRLSFLGGVKNESAFPYIGGVKIESANTKSALYHGRREKRREMVYILGELRDPRALDTLKTIMTEDDPYLVFEAVKSAVKIGGPKAMEPLLIMMHHQSFMERGEVALAMDEMDHPNRD